MEDQTIKVLAAIIGLVILEVIAMFLGFNGTLLSVVIGAIAGLAGFTLRPVAEKTLQKIKEKGK